jgi:SanA protein
LGYLERYVFGAGKTNSLETLKYCEDRELYGRTEIFSRIENEEIIKEEIHNRTHRSRWFRIRYILGAVLALAILSVLLLILANGILIKTSEKYIVASVDEAPEAQVAVVLGALVFRSGNLSDVLADRVDTAIDLYHVKKVDKILFTGDHGRVGYDEVNAMRRYALKQGIPPEDIFMDHAGFSTYESMYRARDIFQVKSAIVVTQRFHLARSVYTARALGIRATGVEADRHIYGKAIFNELREALARTKAFIEVNITHPKPKFLGPQIPITGDGRLTNDESDTI